MASDVRAREEAATRVCFDPEPRPSDLALLGEPDRWRMYRHMVRSRIEGMVAQGLRRTASALGDDVFRGHVARWLGERPPASRYIRDVVLEFEAHFRGAAGAAVPPAVRDLARYEATRWRLAHAPTEAAVPFMPFAFEAAPVMNPALEVLGLAHPVHRADGWDVAAPEGVRLLVVRRADDHQVAVLALTGREAALVEAFRSGTGPATDRARAVALAHGVPVDPAFVEWLGSFLAVLTERTVLLGSR